MPPSDLPASQLPGWYSLRTPEERQIAADMLAATQPRAKRVLAYIEYLGREALEQANPTTASSGCERARESA